MRRFIIALLLITIAFSANADTLSYSGSVPLQRTNWAETISLPQFDPALGTLNSITFTLSTYAEGICFGENGSITSPTTLNLILEGNIYLKNGSDVLASTFHSFCNETVDVAVGEGITAPLPVFGFTIPGFNGTGPDAVWKTSLDSQFDSNTIFSGFAPYIGTGTIPLDINASAISKSSGGGNVLFIYQVMAEAKASITYEYTPIPEPSGLVALLTGLTSIAGLVFRRKNS